MLKRIVAVVLILLVLVAVTVVFFASSVVRNGINTIGPSVLGVPVSVEKVRAFPLRGIVTVRGLVVGNPEGFDTDHLFRMGELHVDLDPRSVLTDTIVIREISVVAPEITYEMTLKGSNIGALQKKLEGGEGDDETKGDKVDGDEKTSTQKPGKKVIIDRFVLSDGKVSLSLPGMMGTEVPIPLPTIEMKDIGREKGGAGVSEAISNVFGSIIGAVAGAVTSSGKVVGDGVSAVGGAVADGATAIGKGAVDALGGAVNALGIGNKDGE